METTLPYSWYTDPEILRPEQERIFRPAWQYVGHTGQLAAPGYFATAVGRTPVVVTRDRDGVAARLRQRLPPSRLRARGRRGDAAKRCSARTTRGRTGSTAASARRRAARRSRTSRRTSSASCRSRSTRGARSSSPTPAPTRSRSRDALGSLPAQVAELGLDVDSLVHHSRWEAEIEANWKIVCENFLECYHCQVAHPAFSEVIDVSPEAYLLSTDGRLSTQHGPLRTATPDDELPRAQFHFLWPNLGINIFPGRPNISIGPIVPLDTRPDVPLPRLLLRPGRRAGLDRGPARLRRPGRPGGRKLVEGVQRGVASGALERGVLMSRSEQLIGHFQALTAAALAE